MILLSVALSARYVSESSLNKGSVLDAAQFPVNSVPRPTSCPACSLAVEARRYQHLVLGTSFLVAIAPSYGRSLPSVGVLLPILSPNPIWRQFGPQKIQNWG